jgi:hypothetical protein
MSKTTSFTKLEGVDGVRESLDPEVMYLFLYAFISFVVTRNAICGNIYVGAEYGPDTNQ